jgi:hypothetical protein
LLKLKFLSKRKVTDANTESSKVKIIARDQSRKQNTELGVGLAQIPGVYPYLKETNEIGEDESVDIGKFTDDVNGCLRVLVIQYAQIIELGGNEGLV